jgi:acyl-ACP thioesterase
LDSVFSQKFVITPAHVDCFGRAKASSLLYFAQEAAGGHCRELGVDWETLAKQGLFWAVLRYRVQITRLPTTGQTITVETWPMPTTKVCYPRSCAAFDENGQLLFQVHSLWILMDANSRAMVLPGKSGVTVDGILRGTELSAPPSLQPKPMAQSISRAVRYSDLDRNGHMNNVKYLDWIADLLCSDFHRENTPSSVSLCYVNEAREGDTLKLGWSQGEDNIVRVEVTEETTNRRIFGASVGY